MSSNDLQTDERDVAIRWLRRLAARGVSCTLRNNRLALAPAHAYKGLSDDEHATLRHFRAAIKDAVREGVDLVVDHRAAAVSAASTAEKVTCSFCQRACVGVYHPAYDILHRNDPERLRAVNEHATGEMLARLKYGNPY